MGGGAVLDKVTTAVISSLLTKFALPMFAMLVSAVGGWGYAQHQFASSSIYAESQAQVVQLQGEVQNLTRKIIQLEAAAERIAFQFELVQEGSNSSPIPTWIKDNSGRVIFVNDAYERVFLKPRGFTRKDYKVDTDVWPIEVARDFTAKNNRVAATGIPWRGVEQVEVFGKKEPFHVLIVRQKIGSLVLGTLGKAWPDTESTVWDEIVGGYE